MHACMHVNKHKYVNVHVRAQVGLSLKRVRDSPGCTLDEWFPLTLVKTGKLENTSPSIRIQVSHVLVSHAACIMRGEWYESRAR